MSEHEKDIAVTLEAISEALKLENAAEVLDSFEKESRERQKKSNRAFSYSGAGKRKFVVETSNWGASLETRRGRDYEIGAPRGGPRHDKVREAAGMYWGYDKETSDSGKAPSVTFISKGMAANRQAEVPFSMWTSEPKYYSSPESFGGERDPFFQVKQVVVLRPDKQAFTSPKGNYRPDNWRTFVDGFVGENTAGNSGIIDENVEYDYLAFDMQLPFNYRQLDKLNVVGPHYAKIRPEYNFYIKNYATW